MIAKAAAGRLADDCLSGRCTGGGGGVRVGVGNERPGLRAVRRMTAL